LDSDYNTVKDELIPVFEWCNSKEYTLKKWDNAK
jgi:hypothetical protein